MFDENWGIQATGWAQAVTNGMLQRAGGNFPLLADANFGASFGLVSIYYKSRAANVASAGVLRLAVADNVEWRNNANSGNLVLGVNGTDNLVFNGVQVGTGGTVNTGTAGRLSLYATSTTAVSDTYVQNAHNITIAIATQAGRSADLAITIPNPGNAVTSANVLLDQGNITVNGVWTFAANVVFNSVINSNIAFASTSTQGIVGTTTNNNAASGNVGEYISSSVVQGSALTITSGQFIDVTSISLTAGDWDVTGIVGMTNFGSVTTNSNSLFEGGISTTTGNSGTGLVLGDSAVIIQPAGLNVSNSDITGVIPAVRMSFAGTGSVYLKATANVANAKAYGRISARRVR